MKASDYIAQFLHQQGVTHVYELVGGMITHLIDSLHRHGQIGIVSVHHEQAAAFAADVAGRLTGIPGVAMATSGPGATNLLTGIGSCYFDSSPAVFITGQVNRHELKRDLPIRQLGFQETDIVSMAAPITKAAWQVETPEELPTILAKAFQLAVSGRPGPVLVDIPMDIQRAEIEVSSLLPSHPTTPEVNPIHTPRQATAGDFPRQRGGEMVSTVRVAGVPQINNQDVAACLNALKSAERPLILAGGGIHAGNALPLFRSLVSKLNVPVVNSLMAVDALPWDHPCRTGLIGSYGNRWANLAIGEADFMLILGSRLDIRQTGADTQGFKGDKTIYHVDCEVSEINNRVMGCHPIPATLDDFLKIANHMAAQDDFPIRRHWLETLEKLRQDWPDIKELKEIETLNPNAFMHVLSQASPFAAAYVVDVGQHQMWAAQSLELSSFQRFVTSGGMGAMGFALPGAIGAAMTLGQPVVMIAGDGSFQLNLQELQTVARNRLPIKMVVINNQCHGMVRQFQESYFHQRYPSTLWGYSAPDFTEIAKAYGIHSGTLSHLSEARDALTDMWRNPEEPYLLQVMVETTTNVYPKIAFGHPITCMEPFAQPIAMEGT